GLNSMFDADERQRRAGLIIMTLAKVCVALELSGEACPLCRNASAHDGECPASLAWSLLDREQQDVARKSIRALALSMGRVDECPDTFMH
ncbi:MAG: hypothetical protein ACRD68_13900, partial [Pyrinomonadaceae bacterium]